MKRIAIIAASAILMTSCKDNPEENSEVKEYTESKKAEWMLGKWENFSEDGIMTETWIRENDSVMTGNAVVVVELDTVFHEVVTLAEKNGGLTYNVTVKGEKPVSFGLTSSVNNRLVFENPKHDFPNKIAYRRVTPDSLVAVISGMREGEHIFQEFPMKKTE
ncbi:MAG: hypothetical protein ITG00_07900 [Flavobacterium sp.]|nr:hypothetical protein [Flavobacterium sp.]